MDLTKWQNVLIEWINCLKLVKSEVQHLIDLKNGEFFNELLTELKSDATCLYSNDFDSSQLTDFLKKHYPSYTLANEPVHLKDVEEVTYVCSLLLHYCCVIDSSSRFLEPLCDKLDYISQMCVKQFLERFQTATDISREMLKESIANIQKTNPTPVKTKCSKTPLQDYFRTPLKRYHANIELYRKEIKNLQCQLDLERFEKVDLQEELQLQHEKIKKLEKNALEKNTENCRLRTEILSFESRTPPVFKKAEDFAENKRLRDEIDSLEKYVKTLNDEQEELQTERDKAWKKLQKVEHQCKEWQEKALYSERIITDLSDEKDHLLNELVNVRERCETLAAMLSELKPKDSADDSLEMDSSHTEMYPNISGIIDFESLASTVVDVQLIDAQKENQELKTQIEDFQNATVQLTNQITNLQVEVEHVLEMNRDLEQSNQTLKADISEVQLEFQKCSLKLEDSMKSCEDLKANLKETQNLNKNYVDQSNELIKKCDEYERNASEFKLEIETTSTAFNKYRNVLKNALIQMENETNFVNENECINDNFARFELLKSKLISKLAKNETEIGTLSNEIIKLNKNEMNLENEIDLLKQSNIEMKNDLNKQINLLQVVVKDLKEEVNVREEIFLELEIGITEINSIVSDDNDERVDVSFQTLPKELKQLENKIIQVVNNKNQVNLQILLLQNDYKNFQLESNQKYIDLNSLLEAIQNENTRLESKNQSFENEIKSLHKQLETNELSLIKTKQISSKLIADVKNENHNLIENFKVLQQENENEVEKLKEELKKTVKAISRHYETSSQEFINKLNDSTKLIEEMKISHQRTVFELGAKKTEIENQLIVKEMELNKEINRLKEKLNENEMECKHLKTQIMEMTVQLETEIENNKKLAEEIETNKMKYETELEIKEKQLNDYIKMKDEKCLEEKRNYEVIVKDLQTEVDQLKKQLSELETTIENNKTLAEEITMNYKTELKMKEKELNDYIKTKEEKCLQEKRDYEIIVKNLETQINQLKTELTETTVQLETTVENNKILAEEITTNKITYKMELKMKEKELNDYIKTKEEKCLEEKRDYEIIVKNLETQINQLKTQLTETIVQLETTIGNNKKLAEEITMNKINYETKLEIKEKNLNNYIKTKDEKSLEEKHINEVIVDDLQTQINQLKTQLTETTIQLEIEIGNNKKSAEEITTNKINYETELEIKEKELNDFIKTKVEESLEEKRNYEVIVKNLETQINQLKTKLTETTVQLETTIENNKTLAEEITTNKITYKTELDIKEKELNDYIKTKDEKGLEEKRNYEIIIKDLQTQITETTIQLETSIEMNKNMNKEIAVNKMNYETELDKKEKELNDYIKTKDEKCSDEKHNYEVAVKDLQIQINQLKSQLVEMTIQFESEIENNKKLTKEITTNNMNYETELEIKRNELNDYIKTKDEKCLEEKHNYEAVHKDLKTQINQLKTQLTEATIQLETEIENSKKLAEEITTNKMNCETELEIKEKELNDFIKTKGKESLEEKRIYEVIVKDLQTQITETTIQLETSIENNKKLNDEIAANKMYYETELKLKQKELNDYIKLKDEKCSEEDRKYEAVLKDLRIQINHLKLQLTEMIENNKKLVEEITTNKMSYETELKSKEKELNDYIKMKDEKCSEEKHNYESVFKDLQTQINQLKSQLTETTIQLETEIENNKKLAEEITTNKMNYETELKSKEKELNDYIKMKDEECSEEKHNYEAVLKDLQTQINELKSLNKELKLNYEDSTRSLQTEIVHMNSILEKLEIAYKNEIKQLEENISLLSNNKNDLTTKMNDRFKSVFVAVEQFRIILENEEMITDLEINEEEEELKRLHEQIILTINVKTKLNSELKSKNEKIESVQKYYNKLENELKIKEDEMKKELQINERLQNEKHNLFGDLKQFESELLNLKLKQFELKEIVQNFPSEINKFISEINQQIENKCKQLDELLTLERNYSLELRSDKESYGNFIEELYKLVECNNESNSESEIEEKVMRLSNEILQMKNISEQISNYQELLTNNEIAIEKEKEKYEHELSVMKKLINENEEQKTDLQNKITKSKSEFNEFSLKYEILQQNYDDLSERHKYLVEKSAEEHNVNRSQELKKMRSAYSDVMAENSRLQLDCTVLRKTIEERNIQLCEYNLTKESYEKLLEDNNKVVTELDTLRYKRMRDKEEFQRLLDEERQKRSGNSETRLQELRIDYEEKLRKMKEKMVKLYKEEVEKEKLKVLGRQEEQARAEETIASLKSQLWMTGNKYVDLKRENDRLTTEIQSFKNSKQLDTIDSNIYSSRESVRSLREQPRTITFVEDRRRGSTLPRDLRSSGDVGGFVEENIIISRRRSITSSSSAAAAAAAAQGLRMEDEEGEVFNNTYLADLKAGHCVLSGSSNRDSIASNRLTELQYRNSLCLPHLKSSYPAETQFSSPGQFKEDDLKMGTVELDDSMSSSLLPGDKPRVKKDRGQTLYKKPGPPTPSKNGGRTSLQGNEVHPRDVLREHNERVTKMSTPNRLKAFFRGSVGGGGGGSSNDSENQSTPKGKRRSIFRR